VRALARVRKDRALVRDLVALTSDEDWLVAMRALDLIEKLAFEHPDWIAPHKRVFIGPLADSDEWEIRLQVVRALPLFDWTAVEGRRVVAILKRDVDHEQLFVKAWALDSLATLSLAHPRLRPIVRRYLRSFEQSGSRALAARARQIRKRLDRAS
jgi:hypothetical protein